MTPLYLLYAKIWNLQIKGYTGYIYYLFFFLEELPPYPFAEFSDAIKDRLIIGMKYTYLNQDFTYVTI